MTDVEKYQSPPYIYSFHSLRHFTAGFFQRFHHCSSYDDVLQSETLTRINTPAKTERMQNMRNTHRTCRVPKSHRSLHAKFILEGSQGRGGVVGPVTPSASSQPILQLPKDGAKVAPETLQYKLGKHRLLVMLLVNCDISLRATCMNMTLIIHALPSS